MYAKILLLDFIRTLPQGYNTMIGPQEKSCPEASFQNLVLPNVLKNPGLFLIGDYLVILNARKN
ncbi:MAG: hypothetical protein IPO92_08745 [Saprospiraceae bacterium]|nr:hypothetical protein [Saprospiraceae bacterium]